MEITNELKLEIMKTIEQIKLELNELSNEYKKGGMTYKSYKRKFSVIRNYNSVSNQVKRFGSKVVKTKIGYEYIGKNFNCELFLDGCEVEFWTIFYKGDNDKLSREFADNGYNFETKNELINYLFCIDREF